MEKALREAKRHTNWVEPDEAARRAVRRFARALLDHEPFLRRLRAVRRRASRRSASAIALGQLLLKLTVPGVPDVYQGDELRASRSSTPTTAGRSTGTRAARRSTRCAAAPRRRARPQAVAHLARAGAARAAPGARSPARTRRSTPGDEVCAFLRGEARCSSRSVSARTRGAIEPPAGDYRDVLAARRPTTGSCCWSAPTRSPRNVPPTPSLRYACSRCFSTGAGLMWSAKPISAFVAPR